MLKKHKLKTIFPHTVDKTLLSLLQGDANL